MSIRFNGLILSLVCAASLPHAAGLPPDPERPLWLRTRRATGVRPCRLPAPSTRNLS